MMHELLYSQPLSISGIASNFKVELNENRCNDKDLFDESLNLRPDNSDKVTAF